MIGLISYNFAGGACLVVCHSIASRSNPSLSFFSGNSVHVLHVSAHLSALQIVSVMHHVETFLDHHFTMDR
jgi:hypothetical protein